MNKMKCLVSAALIGTAALACGVAGATDISRSQAASITGGAATFGHVIDLGNSNATFSDRYNFSAAGPVDLSSIVSAFTPTVADTIELTGFSLFNSAGMSLGGAKVSGGMVDLWTLATGHLVADNYYLLVSGKVLSSAATAYSGSVTVTAVPEPETYGMLLVGAGLIGFAGRRRKQEPKLS